MANKKFITKGMWEPRSGFHPVTGFIYNLLDTFDQAVTDNRKYRERIKEGYDARSSENNTYKSKKNFFTIKGA